MRFKGLYLLEISSLYSNEIDQLYEAARRAALNVDAQLDEVLAELRKV